MTEHEWIHLTAEQLSADRALVAALERFQAPPGRAGEAAASWLKERALKETSHIATSSSPDLSSLVETLLHGGLSGPTPAAGTLLALVALTATW